MLKRGPRDALSEWFSVCGFVVNPPTEYKAAPLGAPAPSRGNFEAGRWSLLNLTYLALGTLVSGIVRPG